MTNGLLQSLRKHSYDVALRFKQSNTFTEASRWCLEMTFPFRAARHVMTIVLNMTETRDHLLNMTETRDHLLNITEMRDRLFFHKYHSSLLLFKRQIKLLNFSKFLKGL